MEIIKVKSINIKGEPEYLVADHQSAITAYSKKPIHQSNIYLTFTGFEGDIVVDKKHHGGNDKAICCYNADRYAYWEERLNLSMSNGAFGENLTLFGEEANERNIFIGDRYAFGEAVVEVSEPRGPCYMIGIKYNVKKFPLYCQQTGYTGFYFRTIKEGMVSSSNQLQKIYTHPNKISVDFINYTRYHDFKNIAALQKIVVLNELTLEWREKLNVLLKKYS